MRALLLACALVAACDDEAVSQCSIDGVVTSETGLVEGLRDCGTFDRGNVNYTDEAMLAAQQCVLTSIVNKQAFRVVYDANSTAGRADSGLRAAFVGTRDNAGNLTLRSYAGSIGGDMGSAGDFVSNQPCETVDATPSCKARVGVPCLTCTPKPMTVGAIVCRSS